MFVVRKNDADSRARSGLLTTLHGTVETPVFMPVGTQATVKTLTPDDLEEAGASIILSNAYHLYLRPGVDVVEKMGGLHKFMQWNKPILTDSGGYQIFSLAPLCQINDNGVLFRSHIDGSEHLFTPESAVEVQERLGADIIMVLDHCAPHDAPTDQIREAMLRTHEWARRCRIQHRDNGQLLFAIVQGGLHEEMRRESANTLSSLDFPGYAIGGLSLGESKDLTWSITEKTVDVLPQRKPRYLMGVGSPEDIVMGVSLGIDMFDSVLPTRVARNGALFTRRGRINVRRSEYKLNDRAVDPDCTCYTCRTFSVAYLHHLFRCEELLAYRLATIHNLSFMSRLLEDIRLSIEEGTFSTFRRLFFSRYIPADESQRVEQKKKWRSSTRAQGGESLAD